MVAGETTPSYRYNNHVLHGSWIHMVLHMNTTTSWESLEKKENIKTYDPYSRRKHTPLIIRYKRKSNWKLTNLGHLKWRYTCSIICSSCAKFLDTEPAQAFKHNNVRHSPTWFLHPSWKMQRTSCHSPEEIENQLWSQSGRWPIKKIRVVTYNIT